MVTSKVPNRQVSLDSRRIRLEREVKIRVPQFDTFVTEYSGNVSTTGMFIQTNNPHSPGTVISFEFSVADDWKLIRGQAQVVWVRHRADGEERPPGMGVRFVELDAQSRRLIRWMVEKHIREGGKPFELDGLRDAIDDALDQVDDPEHTSSAAAGSVRRTPTPAKARVHAGGHDRDEGQLVPLLITAVVVVSVVAILFWLTDYLPRNSENDDTRADSAASVTAALDGEQAADDDSPEGDEETSTTAAENPPAGSQPATDTPPLGSAYGAVTALLETWSAAWSAQDVDLYLSHYSDSFQPDGRLSRSQWAAERRERINRPAYIRIAISGLEMDRIADDRVEATFFQGYRSDRFSDEIRKQLELVWENGSWRILREAAL